MLLVKPLLILSVFIAWSCKGRCCRIMSKFNLCSDIKTDCSNSEHYDVATAPTPTTPAEDSSTHHIIVIVSASCAAVILLGVLLVIILSAILAVNSNKKRGELSCEAIAAQKNSNAAKKLEDDGEKKKKAKQTEEEWFDDIVSPPLPPRTPEMFIFESLHSSSESSCSGSSTITVTVDIEESSDSSGSGDVFEFDPKTVQTASCVQTDKHRSCPKPNHCNNSDFQNPNGAHSYENVPKHGVTEYENITVVESNATPLPPPIPPRPHSNHTHSNHIKVSPIACYSQRAPSKITSPEITDDELPEADRYNRGGINLGHSESKYDGDTTSEESVDMWPPPIPQKTGGMFVLLQKGEKVEQVDKYSIEMTENVAYNTIGGNMYVLHQRNH